MSKTNASVTVNGMVLDLLVFLAAASASSMRSTMVCAFLILKGRS